MAENKQAVSIADLEKLSRSEKLKELDNMLTKFNLFDVLRISEAEIRHSNVLAWLLSPNENHGLGDAFLRQFLQLIGENERANYDLGSVEVFREHYHMDILVVSESKKFVLCIENKVNSGEGSGQLKRYRETIERMYPKYYRLYVFLTLDGHRPEDDDEADAWKPIGYDIVLSILESTKRGAMPNREAAMFIEQYVESVGRIVMRDTELANKCREIYSEHKSALDEIYRYCANTYVVVSDLVKKWCEEKGKNGDIIFDPNWSIKSEIRFCTKKMDGIFPKHSDEVKGDLPNGRMYSYSIRVADNGENIWAILFVNGKNISDEQRACLEKLVNSSPSIKPKEKKANWQWWILNRWGTKTLNTWADGFEKELRDILDTYWREIQDFEAGISF